MRSSSLRAAALAVCAFSLIATADAASPPVAVTTCGQEVPRGTVGYLTGDLDCTGFTGGGIAGMAVILHNKATLELRGFTLTASRFAVGCYEPGDDAGYFNAKRCRILGGGGAIVNASENAIGGGAGKLQVEDVTLSGNNVVLFNVHDARLRNVTITGNERPLFAVDIAQLEGSSVTDNSFGLGAIRVKLLASTAIDNGSYDISAVRRPVLKKGSTCGVAVGPSNTVWDVCAGD